MDPRTLDWKPVQAALAALALITASAPAPARATGGAPAPASARSAAELDAAAQASFDAGEYREAAGLWREALRQEPERPATHLRRAAMVENAVTAYRQVFAREGDRLALLAAREAVAEFLGRCKRAYNLRCDSQPATAEVKALLTGLNEEIAASEVVTPRPAPPEYNVRIGGRPVEAKEGRAALPPGAVPALVGGTLLAAGGTAMIVVGATDARFQAESTAGRSLEEEPAAAEMTTTPATGSTLTLTQEMKGKLLLGLGGAALAIGVGFIVVGAIDLAKHQRLNRRERLSVAPGIGPQGAGVVVSGRF